RLRLCGARAALPAAAAPRPERRPPARKKKKPRRQCHRGSLRKRKSRQRPTLPPGRPDSTIGAGGLNGRVRNGNGCDPSAMVTGMELSKIRPKDPHRALVGHPRDRVLSTVDVVASLTTD